MDRRRLKCPNGHTVARVIGAKCFDNPCPQCGLPMKPSKFYIGGRPLHPDGHREPVRTWVTTPTLVHFMRLARSLNKPLSRVIGDALEELAAKETKS